MTTKSSEGSPSDQLSHGWTDEAASSLVSTPHTAHKDEGANQGPNLVDGVDGWATFRRGRGAAVHSGNTLGPSCSRPWVLALWAGAPVRKT
jgi:hypothetical protein